MAASLLPNQPFHVRSISLPLRSHPLAIRLDEELSRLRTCAPDFTTTTVTPQMVCHGFQGLQDVYYCIQELLRLPSNLQALTHPDQRKFMEAQLDGSVRLLDVCDALRSNLVAAKELVKDLQSALRRNDDASFQCKANFYTRSVKKGHKDIKNSNRSLKQNIDRSHNSSDMNNSDCDLQLLDRALTEAMDFTIVLLQSVSSFLSLPRPTHKASRWSFVSKALQRRKIACEGRSEEVYGVRHQLQTLEAGVDDIESALECLFNQLIRSRVSLLNILSY